MIKKLLAFAFLLSCAVSVSAQLPPARRIFTTSTVRTDIGILEQNSGVQYHQLAWTTTGIVSTCQVELDQSTNNVTWSSTIISSQLCTSAGTSALSSSVQANYVRINVTVLTGGGSVTVTYSGYVVNPGGGSSSGVSALNTLTGAVTLVPGSGITITPSGNNLTIAATNAGTITGSCATSYFAIGTSSSAINCTPFYQENTTQIAYGNNTNRIDLSPGIMTLTSYNGTSTGYIRLEVGSFGANALAELSSTSLGGSAAPVFNLFGTGGGGVFINKGSMTLNGATSGAAYISTTGTGGILQINSTSATVNTAGNASFAALQDSGITGSIQCVHVDSAGNLTGTGSDCPGGGGGNVSNNGTPTANQMAQWVDSTHIKGVTLVPIAQGGTNASSAAAALVTLLPAGTQIGDILYCSAYSTGACTTWSLFAGNSSGTKTLQENSSGTPAWGTTSGGPGSGTLDALAYWSTTSALGSIINTAGPGQFLVGYFPTTSSGVAPSVLQVGLAVRSLSGTTSADTVLYSDNNNTIVHQDSNNNATSLPTPTTLNNPNFFTEIDSVQATTNNVTLTPAGGFTVNGNASSVLPRGTICRESVDTVTSNNWLQLCTDLTYVAGSGITITRGQYSNTISSTGGGGGIGASSVAALLMWHSGSGGFSTGPGGTTLPIYLPIGTGFLNDSSTANFSATETLVQGVLGTACTANNLTVYVISNTLNAAATITLRDNASSTSLVVSITTSSTGVIQDTLDTATIAATDKIDVRVASTATSGTLGIQSVATHCYN